MDERSEKGGYEIGIHVIEQACEDTLCDENFIAAADFAGDLGLDLENVVFGDIIQPSQDPLHSFAVVGQDHLAALLDLVGQVGLQLLQLLLLAHDGHLLLLVHLMADRRDHLLPPLLRLFHFQVHPLHQMNVLLQNQARFQKGRLVLKLLQHPTHRRLHQLFVLQLRQILRQIQLHCTHFQNVAQKHSHHLEIRLIILIL